METRIEEMKKGTAERITLVRESLNMNRSQFAAELGITCSIVSMMEKGKASISRRTAHQIEDVFGIDPVWLQYGIGNMFCRKELFTEKLIKNNPALRAVNSIICITEDASNNEGSEWRKEIMHRREMWEKSSERLTNVRNAFQINQNQLAKKLGFTRAYISAIEKGKQKVSKRLAEQIENEFGISATWLLYGTADNLKSA